VNNKYWVIYRIDHFVNRDTEGFLHGPFSSPSAANRAVKRLRLEGVLLG